MMEMERIRNYLSIKIEEVGRTLRQRLPLSLCLADYIFVYLQTLQPLNLIEMEDKMTEQPMKEKMTEQPMGKVTEQPMGKIEETVGMTTETEAGTLLSR